MKFKVGTEQFTPVAITLTVENLEERRLLEAFLNLDYFMDRHGADEGYYDALQQLSSDESCKSLMLNLGKQVAGDSVFQADDIDDTEVKL